MRVDFLTRYPFSRATRRRNLCRMGFQNESGRRYPWTMIQKERRRRVRVQKQKKRKRMDEKLVAQCQFFFPAIFQREKKRTATGDREEEKSTKVIEEEEQSRARSKKKKKENDERELDWVALKNREDFFLGGQRENFGRGGKKERAEKTSCCYLKRCKKNWWLLTLCQAG